MKRLFTVLLVLGGCGASQIKVQPVQIKPIQINVDVNLHDGKDVKDAAAGHTE